MTKNLIDFKTMEEVLTELRNHQHHVSVGDQTVLQVKNGKPQDVEDLSKCRKSLEAKRAKELKRLKTKFNNERFEKNRQKQEAAQEKVEKARNAELIRQIKLAKTIKDKDIRMKAFHKAKEQTRRYVRQKNDVERYNKKVETQLIEMGKQQLITEQCIAKASTSKDDNIGHGDKSQRIDGQSQLDETVDVEVVDEDCVVDTKQSTIERLYQRESFAPFHVYLDRITMIKKNFHSCEAGRYFLEKTEPLWDSLTNCVYRKSEILREMIDSPTGSSSMPEAYKNYYDQIAIGDVKNKHSRSLRKLSFLGDLINGLNYELTDEEIIEAVKKAKNMLDRHSTAGEIIAMTNVVLEYEIDVKSNVIYVLDGLCGRAVFEYGKKRLSNLLLRKATRMVERLQHLNKINLIPTELLVAKKTEQQVEPIVLDFMTNDEKFGYLDLPDDSASDAWSNGRTKMMQFAEQLNKNKKICPLPNTGNENKDEPPAVYSFDGIEHINNHSRVAIDKLFSIVYKRLAADLAGTTSSPVKFEQGGPMTHSLFGGIVRKMTKIMFSVNGSYEENIYVLGVVIDKVVSEMRHRSPKVQYMRKTKKSKTVVSHALDMSYYPKLVNNLKVPCDTLRETQF